HATGRRYRWTTTLDMPLAPCPGWLLREAKRPRHAPMVTEGGVRAPILAGTRNAELTSHAGSMNRRGMPLEAIEAGRPADKPAPWHPPPRGTEGPAHARQVATPR